MASYPTLFTVSHSGSGISTSLGLDPCYFLHTLEAIPAARPHSLSWALASMFSLVGQESSPVQPGGLPPGQEESSEFSPLSSPSSTSTF